MSEIKEQSVDAVKLCEEKYPETTKEFKKILKEQYEILIKNAPLGFDEELDLSEAYKLVLEDFMGNKEFQKFSNTMYHESVSKFISMNDLDIKKLSNYMNNESFPEIVPFIDIVDRERLIHDIDTSSFENRTIVFLSFYTDENDIVFNDNNVYIGHPRKKYLSKQIIQNQRVISR